MVLEETKAAVLQLQAEVGTDGPPDIFVKLSPIKASQKETVMCFYWTLQPLTPLSSEPPTSPGDVGGASGFRSSLKPTFLTAVDIHPTVSYFYGWRSN